MPNTAPQSTDNWLASLQPTLSCLVLGNSYPHTEDARRRLQRSSRVGNVEVLGDEFALGMELAARQHDLLVLILDTPSTPLPRSLLKHPEVRVLVVAPDGVRGTLNRWLQQGADDLVSPDDDDAYDHALSRLLDASALSATARRQGVLIDVQRRRIEALVARTPGATQAVNTSDAVNDKANGGAPDGSSASGDKRRGSGLNLLRRSSKPRIAVASARARKVGDREAGDLPGRRDTLNRLLALAARPTGHSSMATVVQVTLPFASDTRHASRLDNTIGDLAAYRAADALRRLAPRRLLLGRTRPHRLVLLLEASPGGDITVDTLTRRTRKVMDTLGGLLESVDDIDLDVIRGPLATLAVPALIDRLEQRHAARVSNRSQRPRDTVNDALVPIITHRATPSPRPLAGAQS